MSKPHLDENAEEDSRKRRHGGLHIQKIIAHENVQSSSSDSGDEDFDDAEENDSSTDNEVIVSVPHKKKSQTTRRRKPNDDSATKKYQSSASDKYFSSQYGRRTVTSDKTLSSLKASKMDPQTLRSVIKDAAPSHELERQELHCSYKEMFPKWMFQLRNGFNCLLYGLGSKAKLMDAFRKECLGEEIHMVVNGFFPGLTIKQILNTISEDVMKYTGTFKSILDQAILIKNEFEGDDAKTLFLLIYNIDGPMLRSEKAQHCLSVLASASKIHVLASIDHINAPLIWDQTANSRFNWLWKNTTTFEPYMKEMSFENSFLIQQSASLALSSLIHVIRSLTPNAKGIFVLMANYQLDNENESSFSGISFTKLYQKCREKFLVSSDLTLRAQLTEFRDHKLIKSKKGQDGVEYLNIPLDSSSLRSFLEDEAS